MIQYLFLGVVNAQEKAKPNPRFSVDTSSGIIYTSARRFCGTEP